MSSIAKVVGDFFIFEFYLKNQMKKLLFLISLCSTIGFSQTKELCDLAFSKKDNFKILTLFDDKIPNSFQIIDSTEAWIPEIFFLENVNLKDKIVMEEIERDEHHPYHYAYLFSDELLDSKIEEKEKLRLSQIAKNSKSKKIEIQGENYKTIKKFKRKKGFYFFVSEPIYSENEKFAFLRISIKRKYQFLGEKSDDYFGNLIIMFEKNEIGKWYQIGIKKSVIL
jgi:hypothetical protein